MTDHVLWNPFTYLYPAIVLVSGIRWYRSKRRLRESLDKALDDALGGTP